MSCDVCGDSYFICERYDMQVCERCFGSMISNECKECEYKDECKIDELNNTYKRLINIRRKVINFFEDKEVTCSETIYQSDRVVEGAYDLLDKLFELVKDDLDLI